MAGILMKQKPRGYSSGFCPSPGAYKEICMSLSDRVTPSAESGFRSGLPRGEASPMRPRGLAEDGVERAVERGMMEDEPARQRFLRCQALAAQEKLVGEVARDKA